MRTGDTRGRHFTRRDVLRKSGTAAVLLGFGVSAMSGPAVAMNKAELVEAMASKSGLSTATAGSALDALVTATTNALAEGDNVTIAGFGSFSTSTRPTERRNGRIADGSPVNFDPCPKFATALDLTPGMGDEHRNSASYRCHDADVVVDAERLVRELQTRRGSGSGLSKADAKRALDGFVTVTATALVNGDTVTVAAFGAFSISKRSARTGRNPAVRKGHTTSAKNEVKFKAGAELSKAVN